MAALEKLRSHWREAGRSAGAALLLAGLTQMVGRATQFSHDNRFLAVLLEHALELWLLAALWGLVLAARWWLDPDGSRAVLGRPAVFLAAALVLALLLLSPFTNAYFSHFTHPGLAAAVVWSIGPALERGLAFVRQRLAGLAPARLGWLPWAIAAAGAAVFFVQSYRRFAWFGAGGKDLGLFHQSVWLLSRLEAPVNTVMGMNAFADHVELIDIAAAPLQWLWPSAGALLLFQALLVGLGAVPVFDLAHRKLGSRLAAVALAAVYLLGTDVQNAVMFDWNPTTCGAGLIPWVVWAFERERPVIFGLFVAALALSKENLVLYALALCLTLAVGNPVRKRGPLVAAAVLAVFFVIEMKVVLPSFRPDGFRHLRFESLGQTPAEIVGTVLSSPLHAISLLVTPGRKIDGLLLPLSTVGFACLLAPRYAIALAPVVLERFWSSHANRWWGHHYGAGAGVLATLAAIEGLARVRRWGERAGHARLLPWAVATVLLSCLLIGTFARFGRAPLFVSRHWYYTTEADQQDALEVLARVPADAAVAAQNHLLPFLSARREIHQIVDPLVPEGGGALAHHVAYVERVADFVVVDLAQDAWPKPRGYQRELALALLGRGYGVVACRGAAVLLERNAEGNACAALE